MKTALTEWRSASAPADSRRSGPVTEVTGSALGRPAGPVLRLAPLLASVVQGLLALGGLATIGWTLAYSFNEMGVAGVWMLAALALAAFVLLLASLLSQRLLAVVVGGMGSALLLVPCLHCLVRRGDYALLPLAGWLYWAIMAFRLYQWRVRQLSPSPPPANTPTERVALSRIQADRPEPS